MIKFSLALLAFCIVSVLFISSAHKDKETEIFETCLSEGVYVFADSSIIVCEVK